MKNKYYYPRLSDIDLGYVRASGPGLANCMFAAARAYVAALKNSGTMINPSWSKFSIGPILRKERDKRTYLKLFRSYGVTGLSKIAFLLGWKLGIVKAQTFIPDNAAITFTDLNPEYGLVKEYFDRIINKDAIKSVDSKLLKSVISVHVRLGDYSPSMRVDISWYKQVVLNMIEIDSSLEFALFSDGSDEELKELLAIPQMKRHFYGSAIADIYAISKTKLCIASDSTFSAWGAFLGRVPLLFSKRHYESVFGGEVLEEVVGDKTDLPQSIVNFLKNTKS